MKTDKEFLESLRRREAAWLKNRSAVRKTVGAVSAGFLLTAIVAGLGIFAGKLAGVRETEATRQAEAPTDAAAGVTVKTVEGPGKGSLTAESEPAGTPPEETQMISAGTDASTEDRIESVEGRGFFWSRSSSETSEDVVERMAPASAAILRYIDRTQVGDWNRWIARSREELDRKAESVRLEAETFMEQAAEGDFFAENVLGICFLKLRPDLPVRLEGTEVRGRMLVMKLEQQAKRETLYDVSWDLEGEWAVVMVAIPRSEAGSLDLWTVELTASLDGIPAVEAFREAKGLSPETVEEGTVLITEDRIYLMVKTGTGLADRYEAHLTSVEEKEAYLDQMKANQFCL